MQEKRPPQNETVGERLRRLRLEQGLSQRALSARGLTAAYISRVELGDRRPSVRALRVLAGKLGVSAVFLETGSELGDAEVRELRLSEAELRLRLDGEAQPAELHELLAEALAAGDSVTSTRARIALGLDAASRGEHTEAITQFEEAIAGGFLSAATRPDIYGSLGEAYALTGRPDKAVVLFREGLALLEEATPPNTAALIRFATYLGYALTDLGELDEAARVIERALGYADSGTDPYSRVRLYWSLARISHEQAQPLVALDYFRRAISLLETTEDTFHLARAHLSCADAILASGQNVEEAPGQIDRGERLLGASTEPRDIAVVARLRARYALWAGDFEEAELKAQLALAHTGSLPNERGLALWTLADVLAADARSEAALTYAGAAAILREHGTVRERVDVLSAYAQHLHRIGDSDGAFRLLQEAGSAASQLAAATPVRELTTAGSGEHDHLAGAEVAPDDAPITAERR